MLSGERGAWIDAVERRIPWRLCKGPGHSAVAAARFALDPKARAQGRHGHPPDLVEMVRRAS